MNRIDSLFSSLSEKNQKAFVAYIVAGDPNLKRTVDIVLALEQAGVDIIELGIPFSDPLADGQVNQLGSQRALEAGTTVPKVIEMLATLRQRTSIPIVFFTYYNPIYHYGLERFIKDSGEAGADGALVLDLPPEEARTVWPENSPLKRISLIAPTTPENRIKAIAETSSGFIYYVSREGVTGMQQNIATNLPDQVTRIRNHTRLPVCVGFGISNPEQARTVSHAAEGIVVGSAIVNQIGKAGDCPELTQTITGFTRPLVEAIRS